MTQAAARRTAVMLAIAWACLGGIAIAQTQTPPRIDVTGAWAFEVQTQAGTGTPQVTFKQEGEKLTGHYSSAVLGEADLAGTVKGTAIEFSLTAEVQGNSITLTFSGTVGDDGNSVKGKVDFAGLGEGTFTGKRK
jgi:hypothetical protein